MPKELLISWPWREKSSLTRSRSREIKITRKSWSSKWDAKEMPNSELRKINQNLLKSNQKSKRKKCPSSNKFSFNANKLKSATTPTQKSQRHFFKPHKFTWPTSLKTTGNKSSERSTRRTRPSRTESVRLSEVLSSLTYWVTWKKITACFWKVTTWKSYKKWTNFCQDTKPGIDQYSNSVKNRWSVISMI